MLKLVVSVATAFVLLVPNLPTSAHAQAPSAGPMVGVMVRLDGAPAAADHNLKARSRATLFRNRFDPSLESSRWYSSALQQYQAGELRYLRSRGIHFVVNRSYHILFNGFSGEIPRDEMARLNTMPNIATVTFQHHFRPMLDRSIPLIHAPEAWAQLGGPEKAGRGMMIAIIDSGIDISNPCFRDTGFPPPAIGRRADTTANYALTNNKVIVARAFGGDPNKQYSAADQEGHGTFGAAVAACDYNTETPIGSKVSGVAPGAYLMNYNIFPKNAASNPTEDPLIAALEHALLDGADVGNLSLGSYVGAGDPRLDPTEQAATVATKSGMSLVISAGNAGPTTQSVATPATTSEVIAVGASTNSHQILTSVDISGANVPSTLSQIASREGSHSFDREVGPAPLVFVGLGRRPGDDPANPNVDELAGKDLKGKIALIQRGTLTFEKKIQNAAAAGAIGVIVFDNRQEVNIPGMDVASATLPAMSISQRTGQALLALLQSQPEIQAALDPTLKSFEKTPNVLSDFSAVGYGAHFDIKPDIVAPGEDIYSATESQVPNNEMYDKSGFTSQSGTSFSAPHVAGAVALVLQKHAKWSPDKVKAVLMNTASPDLRLDASGTQQPSVTQQGAGLLNVTAALAAHAYVEPSSLSFGQLNDAYGTVQRSFSISVNDATGGGGTWSASVQPLHAHPGLSLNVTPAVNVAAGGAGAASLSMTVASSVPSGDYDGYVIFQQGGQTLRVPYLVHVAHQAVRSGSVLLVDASSPRQANDPSNPTAPHPNVLGYYTRALNAIGKPYTYWSVNTLGAPGLSDLHSASAVIYFTGANMNGWSRNNSDLESVLGALSSTEVTTLHSYLDGGGNLFVTGMGAAISDLTWTAVVMGGGIDELSVYDTTKNDPKSKGGVSPPRPSALPAPVTSTFSKAGIFSGLKPVDLSQGGDGAGDNVAFVSRAVDTLLGASGTLIGVAGMTPVNGSQGFYGRANGHPALVTGQPSLAGKLDVAVDSGDESTLKRAATYRGRSVLFSFGFEGINNNTGYATRQQVMKRIFLWFNDQPRARVTRLLFRAGALSVLKARLSASKGVRVAGYQWQVGGKQLKATTHNATYRFSRGTHRVRVLITDTLGHTALSKWVTVRAR